MLWEYENITNLHRNYNKYETLSSKKNIYMKDGRNRSLAHDLDYIIKKDCLMSHI